MKRRGYTLTELVVVIAIITMLAGMLFPAMSYIRERSRQSECANNLNQLYKGMQAYASTSWGNRFPCPRTAAVACDAFGDPQVWNAIGKQGEVLVCPSDIWKTSSPTLAEVQGPKGHEYVSYTFAFGLIYGKDATSPVMADDDDGVGGAVFQEYRDAEGGKDPTAHGEEGGNAVFMDGSASFVPGKKGVYDKMKNTAAWDGSSGSALIN